MLTLYKILRQKEFTLYNAYLVVLDLYTITAVYISV